MSQKQLLWDGQGAGRQPLKFTLTLVASLPDLKEGQHVLDLGCGYSREGALDLRLFSELLVPEVAFP